MMIRRDVLTQRDNRTVKWALVAAVFALSVGAFAEHTLANAESTTTATVQQPAPVAPTASAG